MKPLYIIGAGGLGKEVKALVQQINAWQPLYTLSGFIDDHIAPGTMVHGLEVKGDLHFLNSLPGEIYAVIAIGDPRIKESILGKINHPRLQHPILVHPSVQLMEKEYINIGEGSILTAASVFTTSIHIGRHVLINLSCTVGHDVAIGDFTAVMPGCNLSGNVKIGKGVYIGTGTQCINGVMIGDYAVLGAGAVAIENISAGAVAVGVPARPTEKG